MSNTTRRAPTNAIECLTSSVRRILWDGDREIAEISAPRDTTNLGVEELDSNVPLQPSITLGAGQYGDPNTHFGRVVYSPGLAIDQPMAVTRYEYKDAPPSGTSLSWAPFTQMVLWDYRGTAAFGLFTDGAWAKPYQLASGQTDCPIPGSTGADRCVLGQWAVMQSAYDQARAGMPHLSWMGSLLRNKRDGTGLEYKRARVYDPQTGRFTQEDPIGLAGGLNLYGYASGDPVNFSDPFGLRACGADTACQDPPQGGGPQRPRPKQPPRGGYEGPDPKSPGEDVQAHQTDKREVTIMYTAVNKPLDRIEKETAQGTLVVSLQPGTNLYYTGVLIRPNGERWGARGKLLQATALRQQVRVGIFTARASNPVPPP